MNIQNIRVFLAIVENKSISAAARMLYFSQPTISEHLNQLEKQLGARLIIRERGARNIQLTPAGEQFVPLAQRWLELDMQTKQFSDLQKSKTNRLAASSGAHEYIVFHIARMLMGADPELEVRLRTVEIREIRGAEIDGTFDVAFTFDRDEHPKMKIIPLFDEERCILCPKNTNLPDRVISPEELDGKYEVTASSTTVEQWRRTHFPEETKPYFTVSSLQSVHNYLEDSRCWALVPKSVAELRVAQNADRLTIRTIASAPPRTCRLLVSKTYPHNDVVEKLCSCCDAFVAERSYMQKI